MADHYESWDEDFDCHYSVSVTPTEVNYDNDDYTSVHQVYIDVKYVFNVPPGVKFPIAQTDGEDVVPLGGRWCLQNVPRGLSGLRREVVKLLDNAGIPSAAQENTIRMIFRGVLSREYRQRSRASEKQIVGVFVVTETVREAEDPASEEEDPMEEDEDEDPIEEYEVVYQDEDPIEDEDVVVDEDEILEYYEDPNEGEDGDGEYARAVEESIEEGFLYVKDRPAKREVVEALERVRVWGEERETSCAVCTDEFIFGIGAMKMPCSHVFHHECLTTWLEIQCFCPLCKFELPSVDEEAAYIG